MEIIYENKIGGNYEKPFLEDGHHGIFAIRSSMSPNHIGFSIVKLEKVENNVITAGLSFYAEGRKILKRNHQGVAENLR